MSKELNQFCQDCIKKNSPLSVRYKDFQTGENI